MKTVAKHGRFRNATANRLRGLRREVKDLRKRLDRAEEQALADVKEINLQAARLDAEAESRKIAVAQATSDLKEALEEAKARTDRDVMEINTQNGVILNLQAELLEANVKVPEGGFRECVPADVEHETTHCLDKAKEIVCGKRAKDYGLPSENHDRTARMIQAFLDGIKGRPLNGRDVCWINVLQKLSRDAHSPTADNPVDIAGYAQNAAWFQ